MYTTLHTTAAGATGAPLTVVEDGADAPKVSAAQLRRERAYAALRDLVLTGEFAFGQRLGEEAIAAALGVSRTPVREALMRLHADKLLKRYADGGFYIAEPDLMDIRDLYELRLMIEVQAMERTAQEGVSHDEAQLERILDHWARIQADPPRADGHFIEQDEAFHVSLCRASGNLVMADTLEAINARIRAVRMYDFLTDDRIEVSIQEHLAITRAVLARDIPTAVTLMRQHIGDSLDVVEERVAASMSRMLLNRSKRRNA